MRYVILRDDDTNALTPIECLERLYRPFLDRGLPVNLSVIPEVRTNLTLPDGRPEGFLMAHRQNEKDETRPLASNPKLVRYLLKNPGYHIVQHGCHHDRFEFAGRDRREVCRRLEQGTMRLLEAGLPRPHAFVAPHDKLSDASLTEAAKRFYLLSTGWFEARHLPLRWWPGYLRKKILRTPHWQVGRTLLLTHPGCLLSCHRPYETMLETVTSTIRKQRLTVLVTHWWEYYRNHQPDEAFIDVLHQTAAYLAFQPSIEVVSFADVIAGKVALN
jgi:uncharacterized protein DUF2334